MNDPYYWVKYTRLRSVRKDVVRFFYEIENAIRFIDQFLPGDGISEDGVKRLVSYRIPGI